MKIGLIAGGREGSEETLVSLSGVLETDFEGVEGMGDSDEDSEEEQACENIKKVDKASISNDNNSDFVGDVNDRQDGDINSEHAGDIIKHADGDKDYIIVDHNRWKYQFEIKI